MIKPFGDRWYVCEMSINDITYLYAIPFEDMDEMLDAIGMKYQAYNSYTNCNIDIIKEYSVIEMDSFGTIIFWIHNVDAHIVSGLIEEYLRDKEIEIIEIVKTPNITSIITDVDGKKGIMISDNGKRCVIDSTIDTLWDGDDPNIHELMYQFLNTCLKRLVDYI